MSGLCWFEIPVLDIDRAASFYESVFGIALVLEDIGDGNVKRLFPADSRVPGALSFGTDWVPSEHGIVAYFDGGDDLQRVLDRVVAYGGAVVEPKQAVDATSGYWARFRDTEGNLIGLLSPN